MITTMTEPVTILRQALGEGLAVSFTYDVKPRTVEVHAVGTSTKDGSVLMRGYQVDGESSRPVPCWALFTVTKISALSITDVESQAPRSGYTMNDKQMSKILAQISIEENA
jgi:predicted DNA-binding transcriptional regulator YafY